MKFGELRVKINYKKAPFNTYLALIVKLHKESRSCNVLHVQRQVSFIDLGDIATLAFAVLFFTAALSLLCREVFLKLSTL